MVSSIGATILSNESETLTGDELTSLWEIIHGTRETTKDVKVPRELLKKLLLELAVNLRKSR